MISTASVAVPASKVTGSQQQYQTRPLGAHPDSPTSDSPPRDSGLHPDMHEGRIRGRSAAKEACRASTILEEPHRQDSASLPQERGELGYQTNLNDLYVIEEEIGRGAFGVVNKVRHKASSRTFACKSIAKEHTPGMDDQKKQEHLEAIQREVGVMMELRSCLNVAKLEEVFENDTHVHIVQELCEGGELEKSLGKSHYSERTVASYMRAVLRLLGQCHVHNILHRDIKPGNFMLASKDEDARLKSIDFGLAIPFSGTDDLSTLSMQGTPWFLAPETLSSNWSPKSDVWAAGVMAHELLTGRLPFNDKRNLYNPALSAVLRSILTDKLDFTKPCWSEISPEGIDFVKTLLNRDPEKRPTAQEALNHPWLEGDVADRSKGKPLSFQVVQRVQRYGRNCLLRRSLLSLMVSELMHDDDTIPLEGEASKENVPGRNPQKSYQYDDKGRPLMDSPNARAMMSVLKRLNVRGKTEVSRADLAKGLRDMGYRLSDDELQRLMNAIGGTHDSVSRSTIMASQIDWRHLQRYQKQRWLELTRKAFDHIDVDSDGKVSVDDLIKAFEDRIPADELNSLFEATTGAVDQDAEDVVGEGPTPTGAMRIPSAGGNSVVNRFGSTGNANVGNRFTSGGSNCLVGRFTSTGSNATINLNEKPLSFTSFMALLRQPSEESLDLYDDHLFYDDHALLRRNVEGSGSSRYTYRLHEGSNRSGRSGRSFRSDGSGSTRRFPRYPSESTLCPSTGSRGPASSVFGSQRYPSEAALNSNGGGSLRGALGHYPGSRDHLAPPSSGSLRSPHNDRYPSNDALPPSSGGGSLRGPGKYPTYDNLHPPSSGGAGGTPHRTPHSHHSHHSLPQSRDHAAKALQSAPSPESPAPSARKSTKTPSRISGPHCTIAEETLPSKHGLGNPNRVAAAARAVNHAEPKLHRSSRH